MNKLFVATLASVLLAAGLFNLFALTPNTAHKIPSSSHTLFSKHSKKYGSIAGSPAERNYRIEQFHRNIQEVKALRKRHPEAEFVLNKFSPLTLEEKGAKLTGSKLLSEEEAGPIIYGNQQDETDTKYNTLLSNLKDKHDREDKEYELELQACNQKIEECKKLEKETDYCNSLRLECHENDQVYIRALQKREGEIKEIEIQREKELKGESKFADKNQVSNSSSSSRRQL